MNEQLRDLWEKLPAYLGGHMLLSVSALAVGLVVSLPLGVVAARRPRLGEWALAVAGVVQTIPSLALLALMVLLLAGRVGFLPAFVALTLYSVLPILANTVVGVRGVDPALVEAARGLGMSERQMLWRVQLPLSAPVILGGVRTATVLVVGTATLVTPVGGMCLGNYIFAGLESLNYASTVFGCVLAALLAVVLDQLVRLLEVAARRRSRRLALAAGLALGLVLAGGLAGPVARAFGGGGKGAVVSGGPFTEQHILNEVLARELEGAGLRVDRRAGMSEGIQFLALFHDEVDCMVNYTGNVWTLVMKETQVADRETTRRETARYLKERYGVVCLGELGFANNYAFALPRRKAEEWGVRSLGDLTRYAERRARSGGRLRIAGDTQFFTRPEWRQVKEKYGLKEGHVETVAMDQTLMYEAVAGEKAQVDVIVAYTSDGRVPRKDLVLLDDPERAIPPYDAVLLVSAKAYAEKPELVEALRPLVRAVPLEAMRDANYQVDAEGRLPRQAAGWLLGRVRGAK